MEFWIGLLVGIILHCILIHGYKRNLIHKANASSKGMSNVEFIHGKPYVIMHESDYIQNCNIWYNKFGRG